MNPIKSSDKPKPLTVDEALSKVRQGNGVIGYKTVGGEPYILTCVSRFRRGVTSQNIYAFIPICNSRHCGTFIRESRRESLQACVDDKSSKRQLGYFASVIELINL